MSEVLDRGGLRDRLAGGLVRYTDLKPCLNAFIDTRTPGSESKENFTIIGPGVSENPEQFVHIPVPHGFNIGGARQPPGCVNSQHSHDTAEVFVVHTGHWRFDFGEDGRDASVAARAGDVVSFPTNVFRGFTNIGEYPADRTPAFLWSVLGGDDPGRVTWAPRVFELAREHGLMLMENGALIDTASGEAAPAGIAPMPATDATMVASLNRLGPDDVVSVIARAPAVASPGEELLIGEGAALAPAEGFTLRRIVLAPAGTVDGDADGPEVLFVHCGAIEAYVGEERVRVAEGDTLTIPVGEPRRFNSEGGATIFVVRGT